MSELKVVLNSGVVKQLHSVPKFGFDLTAYVSGEISKAIAVVFATALANEFADDAAAAAGGIPVGGLYSTAGVLMVRQA